jgi:hypothetical protein
MIAGEVNMVKTVQNVKNSLKFKAQVKPNLVSVRIGVKKYVLPIEARVLSSGEYMFLSFPACSELFKIADKKLVPMEASADATDAFAALNPGKKRGRRKAATSVLPDHLAQALKNIPDGYRLGYDANGVPRLVRTRTRRKK